MRVKSNKFLSALCCVILALPMFAVTGCFFNSGVRIDHTRTQLYIAYFDGAAGREWLDAVIEAFEYEHMDVSFQEGRTGVQVIVHYGKERWTGDLFYDSISSGQQDVFFTQYVSVAHAALNGFIMDITDMVREPFDYVDLGDGYHKYSISDKIQCENQRRFYQVNIDGENRYFGLESFTAINGIIYDVDLFHANNLFFREGDTVPNGNLDSTNLQTGPTGNTDSNAFDRGLPQTWNQFVVLMDTMRARGIIPFTWSGMWTYQRAYLFNAIWASYEGYNDYMMNATLSGTAQFDSHRYSAGDVITEENAWRLATQYGKLATVSAMHDIVSNAGNFSPNAFRTTSTHIDAQMEFLRSRIPGGNRTPIAMLVESSYWENEANAIFDEIVVFHGQAWSRENRRFGHLPIPRFIDSYTSCGFRIPDQQNTELTLGGDGMNQIFISNNARQPELAKRFVQFTFRNDMISLFTGTSGITRTHKHVLLPEHYAMLSYYQRSVYELFRNSRVTNAFYNTSQLMSESLTNYFNFWEGSIRIGNQVFTEPMNSFRQNRNLTARQWWESYGANYTEENWPRLRGS